MSFPRLPGLALVVVFCLPLMTTACGVPLEVVRDRVARVGPAERRGLVHRLRDDIVVIDDSYNSSPAALTQALHTLAGEPRARSRVAVVGEMLELGEHGAALHQECGRLAASCGLRLLFAVGADAARALAGAAVAASSLVANQVTASAGMPSSIAAAANARAGSAPIAKRATTPLRATVRPLSVWRRVACSPSSSISPITAVFRVAPLALAMTSRALASAAGLEL